MLVAMALTMFIMVIISQAFTAGLSTFRGLKGIGDMQAGLRTAVNSLRSDLMQDHFEGHRRLSDQNMIPTPPTPTTTPTLDVVPTVVSVRNSTRTTPGMPIRTENIMINASINDLNCAAITI